MTAAVLEANDEHFLAYAMLCGAKLLSIAVDGWRCLGILDDTGGIASRAFDLWKRREAVVNVREYNIRVREVKRTLRAARLAANPTRPPDGPHTHQEGPDTHDQRQSA